MHSARPAQPYKLTPLHTAKPTAALQTDTPSTDQRTRYTLTAKPTATDLNALDTPPIILHTDNIHKPTPSDPFSADTPKPTTALQADTDPFSSGYTAKPTATGLHGHNGLHPAHNTHIHKCHTHTRKHTNKHTQKNSTCTQSSLHHSSHDTHHCTITSPLNNGHGPQLHTLLADACCMARVHHSAHVL